MVSEAMLAQAVRPFFFRRARECRGGMKQNRLQKQRKHLQRYKELRTLPARQKKEQRRERTALAIASKRIVAKYKVVARRAAQVTKDILTKQKTADEKLWRLQVAEQKKRVHEYGKKLVQQRVKAQL